MNDLGLSRIELTTNKILSSALFNKNQKLILIHAFFEEFLTPTVEFMFQNIMSPISSFSMSDFNRTRRLSSVYSVVGIFKRILHRLMF